MIRKLLIACTMVLSFAGYAMAALTQQEVSKLGGPVLTVIGAEKDGNKEGTIPPYTGGITKGQDGWYYEGKLKVPFSKFNPKKMGRRPDPFADDKILYTITAQNMAKYEDKLTAGMKAVLARYPNEVFMNVYPTRRAMAYTPEVIEGTRKAALTAHVDKEGKVLSGAKGGFPFPIPKNGLELVWNHLVGLHQHGGLWQCENSLTYLVTPNGQKVLTQGTFSRFQSVYFEPSDPNPDILYMQFNQAIAPPNRSGDLIMGYWGTDTTKTQAWQYLPGQRRVRLAPEIKFDGPNTGVAGASTYDEAFIFGGSPEKYDWKILGKKEMIVPYNCFKANYWVKPDDFFGSHFPKSANLRYELHRVWLLEGTLKKGERHLYHKRTMYLDEDSWYAMAGENYDKNGKLWRVKLELSNLDYDYPAPYLQNDFGVDLISGIYYVDCLLGGNGAFYLPALPMKEWSPAAMAGKGVR